MQVECSGLASVPEAKGWAYKMEVSITADGDAVSQSDSGFRIGQCEIDYGKFKDDLKAYFSETRKLGFSEGLGELRVEYHSYGVRFWLGIPSGFDRQDYRTLGREIASSIRAYLRQVLGDYERLKMGFED